MKIQGIECGTQDSAEIAEKLKDLPAFEGFTPSTSVCDQTEKRLLRQARNSAFPKAIELYQQSAEYAARHGNHNVVYFSSEQLTALYQAHNSIQWFRVQQEALLKKVHEKNKDKPRYQTHEEFVIRSHLTSIHTALKNINAARNHYIFCAKLKEGDIVRDVAYVDQREAGYTINEPISTSHIGDCVALIVHHLETAKVGLAHIDRYNDKQSIENFLSKFPKHQPLEVMMVGANKEQDPDSQQNLIKIIDALKDKPYINITQAYVGKISPRSIIYYPKTRQLINAVAQDLHEDAFLCDAIACLDNDPSLRIAFEFDGQTKERNPFYLTKKHLDELRLYTEIFKTEPPLYPTTGENRFFVNYKKCMEVNRKESLRIAGEINESLKQKGLMIAAPSELQDYVLQQPKVIGSYAKTHNNTLISRLILEVQEKFAEKIVPFRVVSWASIVGSKAERQANSAHLQLSA